MTGLEAELNEEENSFKQRMNALRFGVGSGTEDIFSSLIQSTEKPKKKKEFSEPSSEFPVNSQNLYDFLITGLKAKLKALTPVTLRHLSTDDLQALMTQFERIEDEDVAQLSLLDKSKIVKIKALWLGQRIDAYQQVEQDWELARGYIGDFLAATRETIEQLGPMAKMAFNKAYNSLYVKLIDRADHRLLQQLNLSELDQMRRYFEDIPFSLAIDPHLLTPERKDKRMRLQEAIRQRLELLKQALPESGKINPAASVNPSSASVFQEPSHQPFEPISPVTWRIPGTTGHYQATILPPTETPKPTQHKGNLERSLYFTPEVAQANTGPLFIARQLEDQITNLSAEDTPMPALPDWLVPERPLHLIGTSKEGRHIDAIVYLQAPLCRYQPMVFSLAGFNSILTDLSYDADKQKMVVESCYSQEQGAERGRTCYLYFTLSPLDQTAHQALLRRYQFDIHTQVTGEHYAQYEKYDLEDIKKEGLLHHFCVPLVFHGETWFFTPRTTQRAGKNLIQHIAAFVPSATSTTKGSLYLFEQRQGQWHMLDKETGGAYTVTQEVSQLLHSQIPDSDRLILALENLFQTRKGGSMQPRTPIQFGLAAVQYQAQDPQLAQAQAQLVQISALLLALDSLSQEHPDVLPFELAPSLQLVQTLQQPEVYKIWANMPGRSFENDVLNQWHHRLLHEAQEKHPQVLERYLSSSATISIKSADSKLDHLLKLLNAYAHEQIDCHGIVPEESLKAIMLQNWEKLISQLLEQHIGNEMIQKLPTDLPSSAKEKNKILPFWPVTALAQSTLDIETRTRTTLKPLNRDDYRFYKENHSSPQDETYHMGIWTVTTQQGDKVRCLIERDAQGQAIFQECILLSQQQTITVNGEASPIPIPPQYLPLLHVDAMGVLSHRFCEPFGSWLRGQRSRAKQPKRMFLIGGFAEMEQTLRKVLVQC